VELGDRVELLRLVSHFPGLDLLGRDLLGRVPSSVGSSAKPEVSSITSAASSFHCAGRRVDIAVQLGLGHGYSLSRSARWATALLSPGGTTPVPPMSGRTGLIAKTTIFIRHRPAGRELQRDASLIVPRQVRVARNYRASRNRR